MAATHTTTTVTAAARPARRKVLWTLQVLIAAFLLFASALPKLFGAEAAAETFTQLGWAEWTMYAIGACEAAGAIGLVIPRLMGVASLALIGLMIGAALVQLLVISPAWAAFPVALGVVFAFVAHDRRAETRALLRSVGR